MPSEQRSITTTLTYVVAGAFLARLAWNSTPEWLKRSVTGRSVPAEEADDNDHLTDPTVVWGKIQEVLQLVDKLSEDTMDANLPIYKVNSAFVSMLHLMEEIDTSDPNFRENYFAKEGTDVPEEELESLLKYLDFAHWAYKESQIEIQRLLRPMGYKLLRFDAATEPGRVGHFIAVDHAKKEVIISIKGTSTLSDVLTDIIAKAHPHTLDDGTVIRCHEGMYVASKMMLDDTVHLIQNFFAPQNYKITICGHSLGAGVSSLLGIFLKHAVPGIQMQVYAYATPACTSFEITTQCKDYITCVVNNNDCVPRLSLMNVRMMKKLLSLINSKLEEKGLSPNSFKAAKRYITDLMTIDDDLLVTTEELTKFFDSEFSAPRSDRFVDMELYVPGRVISVWNNTKDANLVGGKVTTGHSQVLKQIFIETNMISDHDCDVYRSNLQHLLEQTANTI